MNNETKANRIYIKIFKYVKSQIGNDTTFMSDLNLFGKKILGVKFKGIFPSDKIPILTELAPYAILNLDKSTEKGSHWVAIARYKKKTYLYDSFGRKHIHIIPNLHYSGNGKIINTDKDSEQNILETNCGQRSIAWLILFDKFGHNIAKLI